MPPAPPSGSWRASSRARSSPWPTGCWRAFPTCPTRTSRAARGASAPRPRAAARQRRRAGVRARPGGRRDRRQRPRRGRRHAARGPPARRRRGPRGRRRARPHLPRAGLGLPLPLTTRPNPRSRRRWSTPTRTRCRPTGSYLLALRGQNLLDLGRWEAAEQDARAVLRAGGAVRHLHRSRRCSPSGCCSPAAGDEDAAATLDEAWRWALRAGGVQRIGADRGRAHRARVAGGRPRGRAGARRRRLPPRRRDRRAVDHRRAGVLVRAARHPGGAARPGRGALRRAARRGLGCGRDLLGEAGPPVPAALALTASGDPDAIVRALGIADRLGASALAARLRERLRQPWRHPRPARPPRRHPRQPRPASPLASSRCSRSWPKD